MKLHFIQCYAAQRCLRVITHIFYNMVSICVLCHGIMELVCVRSLQNQSSYSRVLFSIWLFLMPSRVTLLMHKHLKKRIENTYIDIELVLPMYDGILIFPSKIWAKR